MAKFKTIGIIGCGNMGEAIIYNIKKKLKGYRVIGSDTDNSRRSRIQNKYKIRMLGDNKKLASASDIIIVAVKPQDAKRVLSEISEAVSGSKLLISIMAGITRRFIRQRIESKAPVIRVMPNMPALIGEGISAISAEGAASNHKNAARRIFSCIGEVVEVREKDFDTVTAVSGSGPAYFFYLVEVLIKSAISLGLKKDIAEKLAVKTAQGSTKLLKELKVNPLLLRKKVTSKGGTTEAAFALFERMGLEKILEKGIKRAKEKAARLGSR